MIAPKPEGLRPRRGPLGRNLGGRRVGQETADRDGKREWYGAAVYPGGSSPTDPRERGGGRGGGASPKNLAGRE